MESVNRPITSVKNRLRRDDVVEELHLTWLDEWSADGGRFEQCGKEKKEQMVDRLRLN